MRTIVLLLMLCVFSVYGQGAKFEATILKGKKMLNEAGGPEGFANAYNYFERIAQKEQGKWLPLYYQAQILAFKGNNEPDLAKKEDQLNASLDLIDKAKKLEKNAELVVLEGFVQMLRLTVDPATRGQSLSPAIFDLFNQAIAMDAGNPRALLFLGQMHYGKAQFFGSGFEKACQYIQKACNIFDGLPDEESIYPTWGKSIAHASRDNCKQ